MRILLIKLQIFRRQIKESGGKPMPIAVTELNSHFTQEKPVPYRLTLGSALIYADILRQLLYAPDVLMGNYWQFSNEYWGMIKGHKAPYVERPAYHVARLFNSYLLDELLVPQVKTPVFDSPGGYGVPRANSQKAAKEREIKVKKAAAAKKAEARKRADLEEALRKAEEAAAAEKTPAPVVEAVAEEEKPVEKKPAATQATLDFF